MIKEVALTKYAIKDKFRVEKGATAFKRYANNLKLVNKHFEVEQGLSMIVHEKSLMSLEACRFHLCVKQRSKKLLNLYRQVLSQTQLVGLHHGTRKHMKPTF